MSFTGTDNPYTYFKRRSRLQYVTGSYDGPFELAQQNAYAMGMGLIEANLMVKAMEAGGEAEEKALLYMLTDPKQRL